MLPAWAVANIVSWKGKNWARLQNEATTGARRFTGMAQTTKRRGTEKNSDQGKNGESGKAWRMPIVSGLLGNPQNSLRRRSPSPWRCNAGWARKRLFLDYESGSAGGHETTMELVGILTWKGARPPVPWAICCKAQNSAGREWKISLKGSCCSQPEAEIRLIAGSRGVMVECEQIHGDISSGSIYRI